MFGIHDLIDLQCAGSYTLDDTYDRLFEIAEKVDGDIDWEEDYVDEMDQLASLVETKLPENENAHEEYLDICKERASSSRRVNYFSPKMIENAAILNTYVPIGMKQKQMTTLDLALMIEHCPLLENSEAKLIKDQIDAERASRPFPALPFAPKPVAFHAYIEVGGKDVKVYNMEEDADSEGYMRLAMANVIMARPMVVNTAAEAEYNSITRERQKTFMAKKIKAIIEESNVVIEEDQLEAYSPDEYITVD